MTPSAVGPAPSLLSGLFSILALVVVVGFAVIAIGWCHVLWRRRRNARLRAALDERARLRGD